MKYNKIIYKISGGDLEHAVQFEADRCTGKSTSDALGYIAAAMRYPNRLIKITPHNRIELNAIGKLIQKYITDLCFVGFEHTTEGLIYRPYGNAKATTVYEVVA